MKKTASFSLLLLLPSLWCAAFAAVETNVVDRIMAVVNGEIITLSDFERYKSLMYLGAAEIPSNPELNGQLLQQLIEKTLIVQEAAKLEITVPKKEIDAGIEDILKKNGITPENMKMLLEKHGATLEDYRRMLSMELIQSRVIGREVYARISITDKDVQQYYEEHIKPKQRPGVRVRIQQILLLFPQQIQEESVKEIERKAGEIKQLITGGEDFGKLAAAYSQGPAAKAGGDLGYFHKGELLPAIEQAAFTLTPGVVSPVIRSSIGFHIIKVLDRDEEPEDRVWTDHEEEIRRILYNQQFDSIYSQWFEEVKQRSYIQVNR